ncbi:hypothetical protein C7A07_02905 [Pseudomonas fragi]|nr:hypothetical protein C7A07_02905 [Pseudomonas fragi]
MLYHRHGDQFCYNCAAYNPNSLMDKGCKHCASLFSTVTTFNLSKGPSGGFSLTEATLSATLAPLFRSYRSLCGSGLARDTGAAVCQANRSDAIASKPAPTRSDRHSLYLRNLP